MAPPDISLADVVNAVTPRTIACAVLLGSMVCLANMYFGLQAGMVNSMPMQSALLGFAFFRSVQHHLSRPLSPSETTLIEIIAGSLGLAPFTSGFTSFIPALEFLATPEENGPTRFSFVQLLLWSIATCGLGIVTGAPFRKLFLLRERLRYPSATATGILIGILFGEEEIIARGNLLKDVVSRSEPSGPNPDRESPMATEPVNEVGPADTSLPSDESTTDISQDDNGPAINVLLLSLAGSLAFSLVSYFLPILRRFPLFGLTAANEWLWAFDLSPAYIGYGIIIGPSVSAYIVLGAVIGWGILSPVAKHNGWAPGPVDDWDTGSRGWILWVGMGLILGDTLIGLGWIILRPLILWSWHTLDTRLHPQERLLHHESIEQVPLLHGNVDLLRANWRADDGAADDDWPSTSFATTALVLWIGFVLLVLYLVSLLVAFEQLVPASATFLSVLLIPLASFVSMRSLGETDNGAALAIGRLAQLIITLVIPSSSQKYTSANLLLGGAVESSASQASQHMGGLKTAYMTNTAPRAVLFGQMIGSYVGALIATVLYKLYSSSGKIPSEDITVPDAHLYLVASRFIRRQGLPSEAMSFALAAFMLGAVFSTLRILGAKHWWRDFIPSGVAMAIGMYVVPAISLPRALGALILVAGRGCFGMEDFTLICSATGLIFGQGLFSLVALLFDALHLPTFGAS